MSGERGTNTQRPLRANCRRHFGRGNGEKQRQQRRRLSEELQPLDCGQSEERGYRRDKGGSGQLRIKTLTGTVHLFGKQAAALGPGTSRRGRRRKAGPALSLPGGREAPPGSGKGGGGRISTFSPVTTCIPSRTLAKEPSPNFLPIR